MTTVWSVFTVGVIGLVALTMALLAAMVYAESVSALLISPHLTEGA